MNKIWSEPLRNSQFITGDQWYSMQSPATSSGNVLEMKIFRPQPNLLNQKICGVFFFGGGGCGGGGYCVVCTNFLFNGKVHLLSIKIIYYLALVLVSLEVRIRHGYEEFK